MNVFSTLPVVVAAGIILTSCVESDAIYTLNPDGSGKVEHRLKLRKSFGNWTEEEPDKQLAINLIRGAEGIVAWTDVSHRKTDGGNAIEFRGTGYFPKLSDVVLGSALDSEGSVTRIPIPKLEWEPDATGKGTITLRDSLLLTKDGGADSKSAVNGNGAETDKGGDEKKAKDSKGQDAASSLYGLQFSLQSSYRCEIRVAGTLRDPAGLKIGEDGKTAVFVHDPRLLEEVDETKEAEQKAKIEQAGGLETVAKDGIVENVTLQTVIFERMPPFTVVVDASEAAFDYQAEVSAAEIKVDPPSETKREGWKSLKSIDGQ